MSVKALFLANHVDNPVVKINRQMNDDCFNNRYLYEKQYVDNLEINVNNLFKISTGFHLEEMV